ncbi:probable glutathione S-transferase gst-36 isoform X2 [Watersipora subatra]|uniref:probable glutathione S-transferase gst-36 isoform X2 n=1 Tax=Watersipora subatra TaxID=2589382 RepID=UPI00355C57B5
MAQQDKLVYFSLKARGEPIRMLYTLAEETLGEEQLDYSQWKTLKSTVETPLGQLPTFITKDGTLCHSNTISRYAAKKFETLQEYFNNLVRRVIAWKVLKLVPEPEESEKAVQEQRADLLKRIEYIKSIADQQGKHKFLLCDKIQLADVWLYTTLEFSKSAFEDAMEITPWTKDFTTAFQANPRIKQYLAVRPESPL